MKDSSIMKSLGPWVIALGQKNNYGFRFLALSVSDFCSFGTTLKHHQCNLAAKTVSSFHFKSTVSSMKQTLPEPQNNTVFFQQRRFSPPEDEVRRVAVLPEPPEVLRPAPSHGLNHVAGDAHGGRQGEPVRVATELETGVEK